MDLKAFGRAVVSRAGTRSREGGQSHVRRAVRADAAGALEAAARAGSMRAAGGGGVHHPGGCAAPCLRPPRRACAPQTPARRAAGLSLADPSI